MARPAKPWFWDERSEWCVTVNGERKKLGPHPEGLPPPRKTKGRWNVPQPILDRFHELMAERPKPLAATGLLAAELFDKYLSWCAKHRKHRTYLWYKDHLQNFLSTLPDPHASAAAVRPFNVVEWVDSHADWGACQRRGAIVAIQRPYNWAVKLGYLDASPVAHIEKPQPKRREAFVSPEEWITIRDRYPEDDVFRILLEFCWETGCRPQEAKGIEARHVALDQKMILMPPAEAKGGRRWRRILLEGRAYDIVARALAEHPNGHLFRNARDKPWTAYCMANRFARLKKHLGVKYFTYAFRHGFATRLLTSGIDYLTVAELLGHSNGTMLATVYQHLDRQSGHLRDALKKASQGDSA